MPGQGAQAPLRGSFTGSQDCALLMINFMFGIIGGMILFSAQNHRFRGIVSIQMHLGCPDFFVENYALYSFINLFLHFSFLRKQSLLNSEYKIPTGTILLFISDFEDISLMLIHAACFGARKATSNRKANSSKRVCYMYILYDHSKSRQGL